MGLRVAILGAGRIGIVHGKAVRAAKEAELIAIAEPMEAAAKSAAALFQCDIRSIDQIAASEDIDAVIICTPTDTHADLIEQFAHAGKAIFCEKPIDLDIARVKSCLKTVEGTNAPLMVGFNRRFDPDFMALKAAITEGLVGEVEMITITSRDPAPPPYDYITRSGGIFRDMTIHDFDIARWLLEDDISSVYASGSVLTDTKIGELGDYDSANVIMTTVSGKQCVITNSRRAAYGYDQRIEVHGSLGMVQAQNTHEANITLAGKAGFAAPPLLDFFMTRYTAAYENEINAFVEAVKDKTEPPTTGRDGLEALRLAEAALEATKTGRAVKLEEVLP